MFVMLTNFHQVFVGKEFIIFGSFMGGIFTICLKEQLKEYQKLMNQFIDIKKEVHWWKIELVRTAMYGEIL